MITRKFLWGAILFLTVANSAHAMDQNLDRANASIVIDDNFFAVCKKLGRSPNDFLSHEGGTALILACKDDQENYVKELLQARNLKVNVQDSAGNTALHYACIHGNEVLVKLLLLVTQIDTHSKNLAGKTARDLASEQATKTFDDNLAQRCIAIMQMLDTFTSSKL